MGDGANVCESCIHKEIPVGNVAYIHIPFTFVVYSVVSCVHVAANKVANLGKCSNNLIKILVSGIIDIHVWESIQTVTSACSSSYKLF